MQDLASGKAKAAADTASDKASKASKKTQGSGKEAQKSAAAKLEQVRAMCCCLPCVICAFVSLLQL